MNELRKLVAMEKLITLGISEYCNIREFGKTKNEGWERPEHTSDPFDEIETEMKKFRDQRENAFNALENVKQDDIKAAISIFEKDKRSLKNYLENNNSIPRERLEGIRTFIEDLNDTITVLKAAID